MLNTIRFLNDGNTLDDLAEQFAIKVKQYDNGLVVLNYDQIDSPKFHHIADECRGLIIRFNSEISEWVVVSKAFTRFYNIGENNVYPESYAEYDAYEKADGSLIKIYYNPIDDQYEISTRGLAFAEGDMSNGLYTFREGVLNALGMTEEEFQFTCEDLLDEYTTLIFEYIGPENRIVTRYTESALVILGSTTIDIDDPHFVFDNTYYTTTKIAKYVFGDRVREAKKYSFSSKDEMGEMLSSLQDLEEGFVIQHRGTGQRLKVKSLTYLKVHRIRGDSGTPTMKDVAELVCSNEQAEFLSYFPEFKAQFNLVENVWNRLTSTANELYLEAKDIQDQKEFALKVKEHPLSGVIFTTRRSGQQFHAVLAEASINMKVKVVLQHV